MRGTGGRPTGATLLVQRTDESRVQRWHIGDPANPDRSRRSWHIPRQGTTNATVGLWLIGLDGTRTPVYYDDEYLTEVTWDRHALSLTTLTRDQRDLRVWTVDRGHRVDQPRVAGRTDAAWMDVRPGLPLHLPDGSMVWLADSEMPGSLFIDGVPVTPPQLQVREVIGVDGDRVLFRASVDPTTIDLWAYTHADGSIERLSPDEPGVWTGRSRGGTLVLSGQTLAGEGTTHRVLAADGTRRVIRDVAEAPASRPPCTLLRDRVHGTGHGRAVPDGSSPGSQRLPVLLDPYGGPGHQRVLAASGAYLGSQWFADQGYAVIVADGRGAPGRGPAFERVVRGDLATAALEDQVDALHAVAAAYPDDIDLTRVAIRGWSFGGFLAALAVLRRPDVFHAAVAGAPVTDWRLYDTGYTERFLGDPARRPGGVRALVTAGRRPPRSAGR